MTTVALTTAIVSIALAVASVGYARRATVAAERSAEDARRARLDAAQPLFDFNATMSDAFGPQLALHSLSHDLEILAVELVQNRPFPSGVPSMSGLRSAFGGDSALRLDLGPTTVGQRYLLDVARSREVWGETAALRCECRRGEDHWIVGVRATFPEKPRPWD